MAAVPSITWSPVPIEQPDVPNPPVPHTRFANDAASNFYQNADGLSSHPYIPTNNGLAATAMSSSECTSSFGSPQSMNAMSLKTDHALSTIEPQCKIVQTPDSTRHATIPFPDKSSKETTVPQGSAEPNSRPSPVRPADKSREIAGTTLSDTDTFSLQRDQYRLQEQFHLMQTSILFKPL